MSTVSTVTFTDFNVDPLPDASAIPFATAVAAGSVFGSDPLDTKDGDTSFVSLDVSGTTYSVVTCRVVVDPPVPAGFLGVPSSDFTVMGDDFAAFQEQMRYAFAPTMPGFGGSPISPEFLIYRNDGAAVGGAAVNGRTSSNPAWSNTWWDETTAGTSGGAPVFTLTQTLLPGNQYLLNAAPTDYFFLWTNSGNILVSQCVGQITWDAVPLVVPTAMRILTPLPGGSVWVDVVDGPA